jgi:hypothetical protein
MRHLINKIGDRLEAIETRHHQGEQVSAVRVIRAWIAGEDDPYSHLGPPVKATGASQVRWSLYGEGNNDATASKTVAWPD